MRVVHSPLVRTRLQPAPVGSAEPTTAPQPGPARRLVSLDAFRGITIAAMILVNNPGSFRHVYPILDHAIWNGCRPADLIFPFFLFIVGVAVTLSLGQQLASGVKRSAVYANVARRTLILFALGALLNGFPFFDWDVFRIPGVLQRIALCYGAAAIAALTMGRRGQITLIVVLLAGDWALMAWAPLAGGTAARFGPESNFAAQIDRLLMGGHLLHHEWDPEGLLSTLPAIATTLMGLLAGHWLRVARSEAERLLGLLGAGVAEMALGALMGLWFPINKSLWSSSYAVFTGGAALITLGACYWLIDIEGYRRWTTPFVIFGTNPIIAYFCSSLAAKTLELMLVTMPDGSNIPVKRYVFEEVLSRIANPEAASLLFAVANLLVWLAVTAILYRKRVFIKV